MKSRTREKKGLERGRAKQKRIVEKATKSDSFQETTRMVARSFHILSLILPKPWSSGVSSLSVPACPGTVAQLLLLPVLAPPGTQPEGVNIRGGPCQKACFAGTFAAATGEAAKCAGLVHSVYDHAFLSQLLRLLINLTMGLWPDWEASIRSVARGENSAEEGTTLGSSALSLHRQQPAPVILFTPALWDSGEGRRFPIVPPLLAQLRREWSQAYQLPERRARLWIRRMGFPSFLPFTVIGFTFTASHCSGLQNTDCDGLDRHPSPICRVCLRQAVWELHPSDSRLQNLQRALRGPTSDFFHSVQRATLVEDDRLDLQHRTVWRSVKPKPETGCSSMRLTLVSTESVSRSVSKPMKWLCYTRIDIFLNR